MTHHWVVDTSALIQAYIEDSLSSHALNLIATLARDDRDEIHVPEFALAECANVLWKQVRFYGTARADAELALRNLLALPLSIHPAAPRLPKALEIGLEHTLSIYDAVPIVLAIESGYPFVTVDQKQAQAAVSAGVTLKLLTDFDPA
ncbi:type II toxin-antitoxin system VapC family toxin [Aggregatilinea lenta]|uniref:type II toxin-antitoxin system VapC family toxin n=1 Tax=Aggregatilinea lenta TaxID=913108 RepID=UPI000E5BB3E0|nr:type II toxin-antitoxin system VapC family toxin [Aggregatilinea lenta]